jgi:GrpB-like predicted nucleotidyltransferase (UPF0157 family)
VPIVLPYDPAWPERFRELRDRVQNIAGEHLLQVEHVGSTAVPGMAAKPCIDIDLVIEAQEWPALRCALEAGGYRHCGDQGIAGREVFKPGNDEVARWHRHHLYVCAADAAELRRHLAFRDYLRAHPEEAQRLSTFKKANAGLGKEEYQEAKSPLVEAMLRRALA